MNLSGYLAAPVQREDPRRAANQGVFPAAREIADDRHHREGPPVGVGMLIRLGERSGGERDDVRGLAGRLEPGPPLGSDALRVLALRVEDQDEYGPLAGERAGGSVRAADSHAGQVITHHYIALPIRVGRSAQKRNLDDCQGCQSDCRCRAGPDCRIPHPSLLEFRH